MGLYSTCLPRLTFAIRSPIEIPPETKSRLILALDGWHFEPHKLPDEEVLYCAQLLFEALFRKHGMYQDTGVSLSQSSTCITVALITSLPIS